MAQRFFPGIDALLEALQGRKVLLVCGKSFDSLGLSETLSSLDLVRFSDFKSNPLYEDVCRGVEVYSSTRRDAILSIGGGSAMDVAKCIKLFAGMDPVLPYLNQPFSDSGIPLAAIPTTAGTGSESTRHAVIYYQGEKQSISHPSLVPEFVCLMPELLRNLPLYQKKCTLLDALCQAIESWWSVSATEESIHYSKQAITMIRDHWKAYVMDHAPTAVEQILLASNYAGRAINITATTAPHAMSYKLTSHYGIPHGHAVALCMEEVWAYMQDAPLLRSVFQQLPVDFSWFRQLLAELELERPISRNREAEISMLTASVNPLRLKNNPVALSPEVLHAMYERIVL